MNHNTEAVTGLLDGELKGLRLWLAKRHVGTCPICAAEYRQQQHLRCLLQANPPAPVMSDSADFFWSKVKADIQKRGAESFEVPQPRLTVGDWLQQHQFALAAMTALVVAACGAVWFLQSVPHAPGLTASANTTTGFAQVEQLKTPVPQSTATKFDSEDDDVTVISVTGLPWTPDMNKMETEFANLDT